MSEKKKTQFSDYRVGELRTIADEEFAVEIEPKATKDEVLAALSEAGVDWDMHVANHPELDEAKAEDGGEEKAAPSSPGIITTQALRAQPEEEEIGVKEDVDLSTKDLWLIKMVRQNPLYEVRGHRFTRQNPFALVSAEDAEYLLATEDGFRQATPKELKEYYG